MVINEIKKKIALKAPKLLSHYEFKAPLIIESSRWIGGLVLLEWVYGWSLNGGGGRAGKGGEDKLRAFIKPISPLAHCIAYLGQTQTKLTLTSCSRRRD